MIWDTPSKNKYGNKKTVIDNILFDSLKEAARYKELKLLLKAKQIRNLKIHPKYILAPKGENIWGQKYREIAYSADFEYIDDLSITVEDVKGVKTADYSIRKRLFMDKFPNYK